MNAQVFMEAMGQVDTRYVKEVLSVKVPHYKRIYILAAGFLVLTAAVLAIFITSVKNDPPAVDIVQLPYLKEFLGDNYFYDITAEVGDTVYDVWKNDEFAAALGLDTWEETEEQERTDEPLFVLNLATHRYTFYPDGYVSVFYSGKINTAYLPYKMYTQYQTPEELVQRLLEYIEENGINYAQVIVPTLTAAECVERLLPTLRAASADSVEVLAQEQMTWARYAETYQTRVSYEYPDDLIWVLTLRYPDASGKIETVRVAADAVLGDLLERRNVEE